ncbi:MAG: 23S rRNA (uracil(1939)-C(5))-methyltransferase RlmD, partial [Ruminococcus sp.]|nr:23S rRNA (uracil(1939)-C(5))-methyltransferase RlmD [Ruminococcus sp.]
YRNKAQFPVAVIDGKAVCGFYAPRSHRVIPADECPLQPEIFSDILHVILDYVNSENISVYNEKSGTGILRHIYLRKGFYSGEIMVCIVARKDISRRLVSLCRILSGKFHDIKSIVLNTNPDRTNVILGQKCITLYGSDTISDTMCGNKIEISPLSFYQINTPQAEKLYRKALEYAEPSPDYTLADLYCGAGTIGLSMAEYFRNIIGIEIIPEAVENAKKNSAVNGIENAQFFCGDAGEIFGNLSYQPDIVVVDPPRKGCSVETLDVIIKTSPKKIIMISCNPATAARDSKYLSQRGYSVERVCGCDLFPATKHVECVVCISKEEY